ncbi:hypothetical protein CAEBREN_32336 [Caenorhabditis brenneri]|uniref:Uncharacterized protein n=1 Tax=Caenorhabditis brenneri TaxID=135651 RepID=G0N830_CAEBE|nr:hypothetical protein CAEBREN_32336 [Caenorhabditis brenneri]
MSSDDEKMRYLAILEFLMEPKNPLTLSQIETIKKLTKKELQSHIQILLDVQSSDFDEIAKYEQEVFVGKPPASTEPSSSSSSK